MSRSLKTSASLLAAAALLVLGTAAKANNFSKDVYSGAKDHIKSLYKTERDACDALAGNAKDVCVEEAKGREKIGLAQLEYNYSGKDKDRMKLAEAKWEARYAIAKERCDDAAGNAKDVCVQEAKAAEAKAKANAKLAKAVNEAADDAYETKLKADYKVAAEKCDTQSGNGKDICMAAAKARYGQM